MSRRNTKKVIFPINERCKTKIYSDFFIFFFYEERYFVSVYHTRVFRVPLQVVRLPSHGGREALSLPGANICTGTTTTPTPVPCEIARNRVAPRTGHPRQYRRRRAPGGGQGANAPSTHLRGHRRVVTRTPTGRQDGRRDTRHTGTSERVPR